MHISQLGQKCINLYPIIIKLCKYVCLCVVSWLKIIP